MNKYLIRFFFASFAGLREIKILSQKATILLAMS